MNFCPHCGQQHQPTATFCTNTGLPIGGAVAPAPVQAASGAGGFPAAPGGYSGAPNYGPAAPGYAAPPGYGAPVGGGYAPPPAQQLPPPVQQLPHPGAPPAAYTAQPGVRHAYPLAIKEAGVGTALGLLLKTLPYALARFAILVTLSIITVIWYAVAFGGWVFLGSKIHGGVGTIWFLGCCGVYGWAWWLIVRYFLYLLKCGHIAVLTDLITKGHIDDGGKGMFAYGKDVVKGRFGEVNVLFAVDTIVSGVIRSINRGLDYVANLLPIPGLSSIVSFVNAVIYAATTYLDESIFSYGLARGETNPWASAKDGVIYYAQNSTEILKTGIWIVILDKVVTALVWIIMLVPAFILAWIMPRSSLGVGVTWFAFGFAALLAGNVRAAFLKPLFLVMVMTKFHVQIQNQAINQEWDERLSRLSDKFRKLGENAANFRPGTSKASTAG